MPPPIACDGNSLHLNCFYRNFLGFLRPNPVVHAKSEQPWGLFAQIPAKYVQAIAHLLSQPVKRLLRRDTDLLIAKEHAQASFWGTGTSTAYPVPTGYTIGD